MIIQFFKRNTSSAYIYLPLLMLLLWASGFGAEGVGAANQHMPLYELLVLPLLKLPFVAVIIAFLLVIGEAFLLNRIAVENELISKPSFLVALMYATYMSMNISMLTLRPAIIANLFLLLSSYSLSKSYRKESAFPYSFDAGTFFSLATLFYAPAIFMFPALCVGLFLFRHLNWREWIICFIGMLVPYLFIFTYYFWIDRLGDLWNNGLFKTITDYSFGQYYSAFYVIIGLVILILILSVKHYIDTFQGASQKKILNTSFFLVFGVSALLTLFKSHILSCNYYSIFFIPLSVISGEYFLMGKHQRWINFLFYLLFASIVVNLLSSFI